jgi:hypothetical protein
MEQTHITTKEAAKMLGVQAETIRRGLCVDGHYLSVKPRKLSNRRLLWPIEEVKKVLKGKQ